MFDQIFWFEEQNFFKKEMNANSISQSCAQLHKKISVFKLKKHKVTVHIMAGVGHEWVMNHQVKTQWKALF